MLALEEEAMLQGLIGMKLCWQVFALRALQRHQKQAISAA
jgi:hypothetical protein